MLAAAFLPRWTIALPLPVRCAPTLYARMARDSDVLPEIEGEFE
jgi:hypothetical protein